MVCPMEAMIDPHNQALVRQHENLAAVPWRLQGLPRDAKIVAGQEIGLTSNEDRAVRRPHSQRLREPVIWRADQVPGRPSIRCVIDEIDGRSAAPGTVIGRCRIDRIDRDIEDTFEGIGWLRTEGNRLPKFGCRGPPHDTPVVEARYDVTPIHRKAPHCRWSSLQDVPRSSSITGKLESYSCSCQNSAVEGNNCTHGRVGGNLTPRLPCICCKKNASKLPTGKQVLRIRIVDPQHIDGMVG